MSVPDRQVEILLVEDNPGDVRLTQEALKDGTIPVNLSVAADGVEAIEFLTHKGRFQEAPVPDLVLLDLNLPRKSGREVLKEIKESVELRQLPVIVMTTSRAEQDILHAYDLNANCYITKPLDLDEFLDVVHTIEDFWLKIATLPRHLRGTGNDSGEQRVRVAGSAQDISDWAADNAVS